MSLKERRIKNFKAVLDKSEDEIYLKITHNGHQWSCIALNHREMEIVRELLSQELEVYIKNLIKNNAPEWAKG